MTATEQNEFYKNLCRILGKQASSVKRVQEGVYCWRWLVRQSEFCVYLHGNEAHELGLVFFNQKRLSSKKERNTTIDVIIQEARAFADDHSFKLHPPTKKCRFCSGFIRSEFNVCPYCQREQTDA